MEATRVARLLTPAARAHGGFASALVVVLPDEGRVVGDVVLASGPPPVDGVLRRHPDLVIVLAGPAGARPRAPAEPPRRGTHRWVIGEEGVTVLRGGARRLVRGRAALPPPPGFPSLLLTADALAARPQSRPARP